MDRTASHNQREGRMQRAFLGTLAVAAAVFAVATLSSGPRPVSAQNDVHSLPPDPQDDFRIGLPAYVPTDPIGKARVMYSDSSISVNTECPVRKGRLDAHRMPVYVNGRPIGFCCQPCPAVFSNDPERYLREMKLALRCPVRPARRAVFDSSLRARVNQDIYFLSSVAALKRFRKDPLRFCGKVTDPVNHVRFQPTKASPHVTFRGRDYYFASESTLATFQSAPERYFERLTGT
jgi:YHS domain-containing protein